MWDLPGPGLEPLSSALAGRFSTTAPPGKPDGRVLITDSMSLLVMGLEKMKIYLMFIDQKTQYC